MAPDTCFVPLPRLVRTATFRLSALYAILFAAGVLVGAAAFWSTRAALEKQLTRQRDRHSLLEQVYRRHGIGGLSAPLRLAAASRAT